MRAHKCLPARPRVCTASLSMLRVPRESPIGMWLRRGTLPAHPTNHPTAPKCYAGGEGQNINHARTLARCRGGVFYANRTVFVSVGHTLEKYIIASALVVVSFFALELTKLPFSFDSIWVVNGVDFDRIG